MVRLLVRRLRNALWVPPTSVVIPNLVYSGRLFILLTKKSAGNKPVLNDMF